MTWKSWSVGDIARVRSRRGGFRIWRVAGVMLGATDQESVVELETLDLETAMDPPLVVPIELLEQAEKLGGGSQ